MKLSKLFMIALLAGTLGVIGCGDDAETPDNGDGGTNGTPTGNCDYGDCVDGSTQQQACEAGVTGCMLIPAGQEACIEAANTDFCGPR